MASALELMNRALLNVGENEVLTATNPVGKKAFLALKSALLSVAELYAWPHLLQSVSAATVVNGLCSFGDLFQEVRGVRLPPTHLCEVSLPVMLEHMNVATLLTAPPLYWTEVGDSKIQVYPLPTTAEATALKFDVLLRQSLPFSEGVNVVIPLDFEELVVLYTEYLLHLKHTTDAAAASATRSEFENRLHYLRQRKSINSHTLV